MSLIYSLVSRGHETILTSYTAHKGNFQNIALDVLHKVNMSKNFGQYGTANYNFYTSIKEGYVFLVMVESDYQVRIAFKYLMQIQEDFFNKIPDGRRRNAVAHSLKDFDGLLKEKMELFGDKTKVDKFANLKKQTTQLQEQSLKNLDKIFIRGEKIEVIAQKSETMTAQSYDLKTTARTVRRRMWWKNKKILIGIVVVVLLLIFLLTGTICGFNFKKC